MDRDDFVNDMIEYVRVFNDEVGKNFAVQFNVSAFELIEEGAIRKSAQFDGFADPRDPEPAKIPLSVFAPGEGILAGVKIRLFGNANQSPFGHAIP